MRHAFLLLQILLVLVSPLDPSTLAAELSPQTTTQEIEAVFRAAMEAWAFNQLWRLWEMGTMASRSAISQDEFVDRIRRGNTRPAGGVEIEAIRIPSESSAAAIVDARFNLESTRDAKVATTKRPFLLTIEEGVWRVNLWDFVGLASYFRPDYLPTPLRPTPRIWR